MLKVRMLLFMMMIFTQFVCADENIDDYFIQLLHHEPSYFLMGKPNTKVQLSIKVKILKNSPLYFSYTQKIFWDFFKESRPFKDLNYNPAFFYRIKLGESDQNAVSSFRMSMNQTVRMV